MYLSLDLEQASGWHSFSRFIFSESYIIWNLCLADCSCRFSSLSLTLLKKSWRSRTTQGFVPKFGQAEKKPSSDFAFFQLWFLASLAEQMGSVLSHLAVRRVMMIATLVEVLGIFIIQKLNYFQILSKNSACCWSCIFLVIIMAGFFHLRKYEHKPCPAIICKTR